MILNAQMYFALRSHTSVRKGAQKTNCATRKMTLNVSLRWKLKGHQLGHTISFVKRKFENLKTNTKRVFYSNII